MTENCHSDPYGEESCFPTRIKPRFFTPLRSVQNDTIGGLGHPVELLTQLFKYCFIFLISMRLLRPVLWRDPQ